MDVSIGSGLMTSARIPSTRKLCRPGPNIGAVGVSGGFAAASHRAASHQPVRDVEEELGLKLSHVRTV